MAALTAGGGVGTGVPLPVLVIHARPGWAEEVRDLLPGSHIALFAEDENAGIEGRLLGLELRDTILLLRSGPKAGLVFVFRVPLMEGTVAAQVLSTGTGGINTNACRVGSSNGRWPSNVTLVHGKTCTNIGSRTVPTSMGVRGSDEGNLKYGGGKGLRRPNHGQIVGYGDEDGMETVESWECEPDCPAQLLSAFGEVSRFYPQFADEGLLVAWITRLLRAPQSVGQSVGVERG